MDIGGSFRAGSRTGGLSETFSMTMKHLTGAEEDIKLLGITSGSNQNIGYFGGASGSNNCLTQLDFYIGSTWTTLTGTKKIQIDNDSTTFYDDVVIDSSLTVNAWASILDSLFIPQFNGGLPATPSSGFFGADTANDTIVAMLGEDRVVVYPVETTDSADVAGWNFANYGYVGTFTDVQILDIDKAAAITGLTVQIDSTTGHSDEADIWFLAQGTAGKDNTQHPYSYKDRDGNEDFYVDGTGYTKGKTLYLTDYAEALQHFKAPTIYGDKFEVKTANTDLIICQDETDEFIKPTVTASVTSLGNNGIHPTCLSSTGMLN